MSVPEQPRTEDQREVEAWRDAIEKLFKSLRDIDLLSGDTTAANMSAKIDEILGLFR